MPHLSRVDRVRGCLLGLAVGDALGAPLEGLSPQQIKTHYGRIRNYVDGVQAWKRKPYRWRLRGLYSDDTQQALALCDILLDFQRIDQERLADLYLALMTPKGAFVGAHRGIGRSFRQVLAALERGTPARLTGQTTAGIGAAMRIAPISLYFREEQTEMFDSVMAASLMTHRDIRSIGGALGVVHAVRRLVAGEPRDPSLLLWVASDLLRDEKEIARRHSDFVINIGRHGHSLSHAIARVEALLELPRERVFAALVEQANRHGAEPACRRPTMGFPPACIPTCLYLLLTTSSFEEAITEVVNLGGDADTAGAILGAMAGAYYGADAIPTRWLDGLQNREGIETRALALSQRSTEGLLIPDLVATEHELSRREGECFEQFASASRDRRDRGANHVL
ncbi:MAG: ADP-ribosylglycohydrolase family protein [Isosphaeraceae bacterium]